jgi:hypothetical protein
MKKTIHVVKGKIENLKRVVTRTENSMVTFRVGGTPCKAFGKGAEMMIRWVKDDPNSIGEFEGHFDGRSEKYGREFIAAHGRLVETKTIDKINSPDIAAPGTGVADTTSPSEPSVPAEPIPANGPDKSEPDFAAESPSHPLTCMPSPPTVDCAAVKPVTFEDLENEYKTQKLKRQLKNSNQQIATAQFDA